MILDIRSLFSNKQAVVATAASTNSYDLGVPGVSMPGQVQLKRNMGKGIKIPVLVQINEKFVSGDGMTSMDIALQTDEDVAFGSPKTVLTVNVLIADLIAGYVWPVEFLPRDIKERYVRFYYTLNGGTASAGKVTAGIVAAVDGSYQG